MLVPGSTLVTLALTMGLSLVTVRGGALRYDQTQTGDTNIHLQIKNVEVLALLDDSGAGDYDYDYSDYTEKPGPGKPGSNETIGLKPPPPPVAPPPPPAPPVTVDASNSTAPDAAPTNSTLSNSPEEPLLRPTPTAAATPEETTTPASSSASKKSRRCGAGFYRDNSGRCRRIRRPHLQMMMSLGRTKTTESPAV